MSQCSWQNVYIMGYYDEISTLECQYTTRPVATHSRPSHHPFLAISSPILGHLVTHSRPSRHPFSAISSLILGHLIIHSRPFHHSFSAISSPMRRWVRKGDKMAENTQRDGLEWVMRWARMGDKMGKNG